jgi:NAD+ synthetase
MKKPEEYDVTTLQGLIEYCKDLRGFYVYDTLISKAYAINKFFEEEKLDSVVIGLSGGIDSALVYYLMLHASMYPKSPIKQVHGIFMPIKSRGITGQDAARFHYNELINCIPEHWKFKAHNRTVDLSSVANQYYIALNPKDDWTCGQIASIVRTPALYGAAAKLQSEEHKSIVVGTTNRDEGAYIGFFGKASDGMVDLQPIADLHKSEVREMAKILGVPKEIINRPPEGDVWNDVTDEELFGATYDVLEMYQTLLDNNATYLISKVKDSPELVKYILNIESAHEKNLHKYKVGSPARYVDVLKREIFCNNK